MNDPEEVDHDEDEESLQEGALKAVVKSILSRHKRLTRAEAQTEESDHDPLND